MTKSSSSSVRRIVVGVDGSSSSVDALRWAIEGYAPTVLVAASADADLLVVGSRGHGTFTEALVGSVSQNCAHHAKCPVVIVRGQS